MIAIAIHRTYSIFTKIFRSASLILACGLFLVAAAQNPNHLHHGNSGTDRRTQFPAHEETSHNRVKPSMTAQYETARKRHWVWHQKMQDTWAYHIWKIVSGEASGTYMVCSFGHTWKEVDENAVACRTGPLVQLY